MYKRNVYVHQIQAPADKNLLPLSAGLISSYARSIPDISVNFEIDIKILRESPKDTIQSYRNPDVLGFSAYSWNFQQSLEVARLAKQQKPNVLVVFGGPMVGLSQRPDEMDRFFRKYPFIDIAVHGMGEWAFSQILLTRLDESDWDSIPGLSYRSIDAENGYVSTSPGIFRRDLNELPSPFLDGTFEHLLSQHGDHITGALWETNRGCPFHCSFCVQGDQIFDKILMFDSDRLYQELEWMSESRIEYIFATDANFGIKKRDAEIASYIAKLKSSTGFPKFFMVNWTKNSSTSVLRTASALREGEIESRLTLGRQSFSQPTLKAVKRQNIKLSTYDELIQEATSNNVATYTELILGLPDDTYHSFVRSIESGMDLHQSHYFVVYLCRLLEGTDMASSVSRKSHSYDTRISRVGFGRTGVVNEGVDELEEIIVGTATMPVEDWRKAHTFAHIALTLYNTRIAFFILNYLRREYGVKMVEFIEYLIDYESDGTRNHVISEGISTIRKCQENILGQGPTVCGTEFTESMTYEPHEAAALIFLNKLDEFYCEIDELITAYLTSIHADFDRCIMADILKYQSAIIPTWHRPLKESISFDYNIPEYFEALCKNDQPIPLVKRTSSMVVSDPMGHIDDPVLFSKQKFTVAMFKIAQPLLS